MNLLGFLLVKTLFRCTITDLYNHCQCFCIFIEQSVHITYDLVVCAYSLLELPSLRARLQAVLGLWNKTAKYLVIVEQGTNAGFKVINEVRDYILSIEGDNKMGHVFSPCPHDKICPRFISNDNTPCNFEVGYYSSIPLRVKTTLLYERYSYVVLQKGKRDTNIIEWPRIVRYPLVRSGHTVCRMCTNEGKLKEIIFSKGKLGLTTYHCARMSEWGDRLPLQITFKNDTNFDSEQKNDESKNKIE